MLLRAALFLISVTEVTCLGIAEHTWQAPQATDRRSPCPMINSLANHGFLPRDGFNVSYKNFLDGFEEALNLHPDATATVVKVALKASTTGDPGTLNLDDLSKHGVIEHDGSLSRQDVYFGDNHSFNPELWASTATAFFTSNKISISTAARARSARLAAASAANPTFSMSTTDKMNSLIETASYLRVFGNGILGNARTDWVKILFQEERLAYEEGFTRSESVITQAQILVLVALVAISG